MKRTVAVVGAAAAFFGAVTIAQARVMTPSSTRLGAGTTSVTACGSLAGLGYSVANSTGSVTSLTFSGLPSSCNGASLSVRLTSSGTSQGGGGPVTIVNGSANVTVSPAVPNAAFNDIRLIVSGP